MKNIRLATLFALCCSFILTSAALAQHNLSWGSPVENTDNTSRSNQDDGLGAAQWPALSYQFYVSWFDANNNLIVKSQDPGAGGFTLNTAVTDAYTGASDSKKPSVAVTSDGSNLMISFVQNGALKVLVVNYLNPTHYSLNLSPCSNQVATYATSLLVTSGGLNYLYFIRSSDHALSSCVFDLNGNSSSTNSSILAGTGPSAIVFNGLYHVYFKANDSSNKLYEADGNSPDSSSLVFSTAPSGSHTSTQPSAIVYDNTIYVGFRQNDPNSHAFFYTQSGNGVSYSGPILVNWSMGGPPELVANQSTNLYNIFRQNDSSSYLFEASSY